MTAKITLVRCQDLDCCRDKPNPCQLEVRGDNADEVVRLMRSHAQIMHQAQYLPEQLRRELKEAA